MKRASAIALCASLLILWACLGLASVSDETEFAQNILQDEYAMRGVAWDLTADEVLAAEGGELVEDDVRVDKPELYKLDALRLTYLFEDGQMTARSFRLKKDDKVYASMFISLFMRYGIPYLDEKKNMTKVWMLDDVRIELSKSNYVYVVFERIAPEESA